LTMANQEVDHCAQNTRTRAPRVSSDPHKWLTPRADGNGMQQLVLGLFPPWAVLSALLGVMHAALFHLLFGQHVRRLPAQIALGLVASTAGGLLGTMIPPTVVAVGETNLIATTVCAWLALAIARLFRFC